METQENMKNQSRKYKIWIVDDNQEIIYGIQCILKDYTVQIEDLQETVTFEIESFNSGEDFLSRIKEIKPDIILLDDKLPGIEGIEILKQLSQNNISILAIMITAYATIDKAVSATKLGAYDFIAKPFTPNEMRHALRKACRNLILTEKTLKLEDEKKRVRYEFISTLAHELKSPINVIEGYANIMINRSEGGTLDAYDSMINRIKIRTCAMRKLIVDLLDLTSIESGKKIRVLETINLRDVVTQIIDNCKDLAAEKNVHIDANILCEPVYTADRIEMEMIFSNFITNGIKYNKENGHLIITIEKNKQGLIITFADTGIGMNEEEQKTLFKEFSRIKNVKTRNTQGSGLGLSITSKIITLYKGEISVKSIPDIGTSFIITLPFTQ